MATRGTNLTPTLGYRPVSPIPDGADKAQGPDRVQPGDLATQWSMVPLWDSACDARRCQSLAQAVAGGQVGIYSSPSPDAHPR